VTRPLKAAPWRASQAAGSGCSCRRVMSNSRASACSSCGSRRPCCRTRSMAREAVQSGSGQC